MLQLYGCSNYNILYYETFAKGLADIGDYPSCPEGALVRERQLPGGECPATGINVRSGQWRFPL